MHPILKSLGALACCLLSLASTAARADGEAGLRAAIAAEQARTTAPQIPRDAFLASPLFPSVRLSPDGRHVAYLRARGEQRSLWLLPTAGGAARPLLPRTQANDIAWSRDGRWLFVEATRSLATVDIDGRAGIRIPLRGTERRVPLRIDPSQPAAMVLRERMRTATGEGWRLVRIDVRGKRTVLHEGQPWIADAAIDARGRLAALVRFEGEHDVLYRVDAAGRLRQVLRWNQMGRAALLAVLPDGDVLMRGNVGGNFVRVLRVDADGKLHTLHEDPRGEADLDEVALDPATQQPVAASYRSTVAATYGLGSARTQVDALRRRLAGRDLGVQVGGGWWLVSERDSTLRDPRWHLYGPRSDRLRPILAPGAGSTRRP